MGMALTDFWLVLLLVELEKGFNFLHDFGLPLEVVADSGEVFDHAMIHFVFPDDVGQFLLQHLLLFIQPLFQIGAPGQFVAVLVDKFQFLFVGRGLQFSEFLQGVGEVLPDSGVG